MDTQDRQAGIHTRVALMPSPPAFATVLRRPYCHRHAVGGADHDGLPPIVMQRLGPCLDQGGFFLLHDGTLQGMLKVLSDDQAAYTITERTNKDIRCCKPCDCHSGNP